MKGKKFLPRSPLSHFVGMESNTRLIKVFVSHLKSFRVVRISGFRKYKGTPLPVVEDLLDVTAKQVEKESSVGASTNAE